MKKKISPKFIVLAIILGLAAYFGVKKIIFSLTHETTDNGQVDTQIVPILSRVSGYVKALYVKDFDSWWTNGGLKSPAMKLFCKNKS